MMQHSIVHVLITYLFNQSYQRQYLRTHLRQVGVVPKFDINIHVMIICMYVNTCPVSRKNVTVGYKYTDYVTLD